MSPGTIDPPLAPRQPRQPLVTRTSILLLAGMLIGYGLQYPVPTGMHQCVLGAGTIGLLAFLGLEMVEQQSRKIARWRAFQRLNWTLAVRIHKHISRLRPHTRVEAHRTARDSTFVSVVSSRC